MFYYFIIELNESDQESYREFYQIHPYDFLMILRNIYIIIVNN